MCNFKFNIEEDEKLREEKRVYAQNFGYINMLDEREEKEDKRGNKQKRR